MIETSATHWVPKGWSDQFSWEKRAKNRPYGGYDNQAEPWNINLCSPVQKPDDRDEKGYSKENVQLEWRHRGEIFTVDALQQINLLK